MGCTLTEVLRQASITMMEAKSMLYVLQCFMELEAIYIYICLYE